MLHLLIIATGIDRVLLRYHLPDHHHHHDEHEHLRLNLARNNRHHSMSDIRLCPLRLIRMNYYFTSDWDGNCLRSFPRSSVATALSCCHFCVLEKKTAAASDLLINEMFYHNSVRQRSALVLDFDYLFISLFFADSSNQAVLCESCLIDVQVKVNCLTCQNYLFLSCLFSVP